MARKIVRGSTPKAARRKARKKKGAIAARRKKEFTFRGFTLDQLQKMTLAEVLPLLPARARRSYSRGLNPEEQAFIDRLMKDDGVVRTHRRAIVILPSFVGKTVAVYTGKEFKEVEIKPEMIGHYLGEFALTRSSVRHSGPGVGATKSSKFMPLK
ncbi:MAG: 30S ribosomal protein S19 [Thermoplasmata archaeon]|nr:30S ribosomal protein S19 [Thermoplasmata archaeon]